MIWLLLLAQAGAVQAGARPEECGAQGGTKSANLWERAKSPELRAYCDLLASGTAKLAGAQGNPRDVLAIADEADKRLPGKLAPSVLRGRALERLRRFEDAFAALSGVHAKDPRALEDASALLAFGRAAARTSHPREAEVAYRALLPRAVALPTAERGAAYVEAALLVMNNASPSGGASNVDEAVAIFRQARKDAQDVAQTIAWLGLALALDRAGSRDEARAVLGERARVDPKGALQEARARDLVPPTLAHELDAMAAVAYGESDLVAAREAYKRFIDAGKGPFVEHAKSALAALGKRR